MVNIENSLTISCGVCRVDSESEEVDNMCENKVSVNNGGEISIEKEYKIIYEVGSKDLDLKENYSFPGVWALIGKKRDNVNAGFQCLQVGQTKNIAKEICQDIKYLQEITDDSILTPKKEIYINHWQNAVFEYNRIPKARELSYRDINSKYDNLLFILLIKQDSEKERFEIEKDFAERTAAVYWRNFGGQYKSIKTEIKKSEFSFKLCEKMKCVRLENEANCKS